MATFLVRPELNGHGPVRSRAVYERIRERLSAQPGVIGVTAASRLLLDGGPGAPAEVRAEGVEPGPGTDRATRLERIGTDYFRTLGIPLLSGRTFSESDTLEAPKVAIVNESFARKFELGRDAVGRRIGRGGPEAELDVEIVGLVGSVRRRLRSADTPPVVFVPYRQEEEIGGLWFYVRSSAGSEAVVRSVSAVVAAVDPNLPAAFPMPMSRAVEMNSTDDRMAAGLLASFAALATLLAAVGLYGVLAYAVAQRTREIGLRMALGADAARLRAMVLGQVGRMTLAGGALGLAAAFGLGRALQSLLYEIEGMPPAIVAVVVAGTGRRGSGGRPRPRAPGGARRPDGSAAAPVASERIRGCSRACGRSSPRGPGGGPSRTPSTRRCAFNSKRARRSGARPRPQAWNGAPYAGSGRQFPHVLRGDQAAVSAMGKPDYLPVHRAAGCLPE